jgi:hypothetical protein
MKKGTLVKMTEHGFKFYHNPVKMFDGFQIRGKVEPESFNSCVCELLAVLGTGTIIKVEPDQVKVKWKFKNKGMYFYYTMWYANEDVRKLTLFEKILNFIGVK